MEQPILTLDKADFDANGFLRVDTTIASAGVLEYVDPITGKTEIGYMPEEEIKKAIGQIPSTPLTDEHPPEGVTPDNFQDTVVGFVDSGLKMRQGKLEGTVVVCRKEGIDSVAEGKRDVSMGYAERKDYTPGTFIDVFNVMGQGHNKEFKYDYVKRDIKLNHVALCEEGRSLAAEMRFDSADYTSVGSKIAVTLDSFTPIGNINKLNKDSKNMTDTETRLHQLVIDSQIVNVTEDSKQAILDMMGNYDAMKEEYDAMIQSKKEMEVDIAHMKDMMTKMDAMKSELEETKDSLSSFKGKYEALEAQSTSATDAKSDLIGDAVNNRLSVWAQIGGINNSVVAFDAKLTETEIKQKWLVEKYPSKKEQILAGDSMFVDGMFEASDKNLRPATQAFNHQVKDSALNTQAPSELTQINPDGSFSIKLTR